MNSKSTHQSMMLMLLALGLTSCSSRDATPTAAELAWRQQMREATAATESKSLEETIEAIRKYLDDGNLIAAQKELRPLVNTNASHPDVVVLAARCEAADGDKAVAAKMLMENAKADQETIFKSLFLASKWYLDINEFELAEIPLKRVLELSSDVPSSANAVRAHRQLAMLFNNQGRRLAAAEHLQFLAVSGEIQEKELFAMNTYGDPFIDTLSPKPDFSKQLIPAALAEAKIHRHERDLTEAVKLIDRLALRFPLATGIAAFRGRIYADLHDAKKLEQWRLRLPKGIEAEPEYWFAMGALSDLQGEQREAVRCFAEAVKRDPTDRFSYLALSQSLEQLGEVDASERVRERFALLDEAARLARKFGVEKGAIDELDRMAELLWKLRRDSEAIAWQTLAMTRFGASETTIAELNVNRDLAARGELPRADEAFLVCGLKLDEWPLPEKLGLESVESPNQALDSGALSPDVQVRLVDVAAKIGIEFKYQNGDNPEDDRILLHQLTGGGIGVIDLDLDGWPDLYLTQGGGDAFDPNGSLPNRLFRNQGGEWYHDITAFAACGDFGYGQGVAVADLNQDGLADLLVANIGPNRIYINQGDGTFALANAPDFESEANWTTSIACGDLSGDGLPEIVEVNYVADPSALEVPCTSDNTHCNPSTFQSAKDHVWKVQADGRITRADDILLGGSKPGYGFAAIIANFDEKFGNDLFIANDTIENFFWRSQPAELTGSEQTVTSSYKLSETSHLYGCATGLLGQRQGCMGVASGDFDRNGRIDIHVTNFWNQSADLYLQRDNGFFVHGSLNRGLDDATKKTVAWGSQAADFDRNGWLDLAVLNGHLIDRKLADEPYQMQAQLFLGNETGFHLMPASSSKNDYWGRRTLGRTMAMLDWNRDAKPDLVCNHLDAPLALLENQTAGGNALQFELVGVASERDAIAAKVTVTCGDDVWTSWVMGGDGFLCSNEAVLDIGIGSHDRVDSVQVDWSSGERQQLSDIVPNQRYLLMENEPQAFARLR